MIQEFILFYQNNFSPIGSVVSESIRVRQTDRKTEIHFMYINIDIPIIDDLATLLYFLFHVLSFTTVLISPKEFAPEKSCFNDWI